LVAEPLKAGERSEKAEPFRSSADIAQKNNLLSDLIFKDHQAGLRTLENLKIGVIMLGSLIFKTLIRLLRKSKILPAGCS
jgi:hypothetical protein